VLTLSAGLAGSDFAIEGLDGMLTVLPEQIAAGAAGTSNLNWSFDSGAAGAFDALPEGEWIRIDYTLRATDDGDGALSGTQVVSVTVRGTNDAPTLALDAPEDFIEADRPQDLVGAGKVMFDDVDFNDRIDISWRLQDAAVWSGGTIDAALASQLEGALILGTTGASVPGMTPWGFNAQGVDLDFLAEGQTVTLAFTVVARDAHGAEAEATLAFASSAPMTRPWRQRTPTAPRRTRCCRGRSPRRATSTARSTPTATDSSVGSVRATAR
jgi:VCBS repeat-containing protein